MLGVLSGVVMELQDCCYPLLASLHSPRPLPLTILRRANHRLGHNRLFELRHCRPRWGHATQRGNGAKGPAQSQCWHIQGAGRGPRPSRKEERKSACCRQSRKHKCSHSLTLCLLDSQGELFGLDQAGRKSGPIPRTTPTAPTCSNSLAA